MNEMELSRLISEAAQRAYESVGGTGLLERVYRDALAAELEMRGFTVTRETIPAGKYPGVTMTRPTTIDMIVDGKVIVMVKVMPQLKPVFEAEALSYLRITGLKLALIVNFGAKQIKSGIRRVVNQS